MARTSAKRSSKKKSQKKKTARRAKPLRLATIDVGSNAVRLYIAERTRAGHARTLVDERAAVRLGADVFARGTISAATTRRLGEAFTEFRKTCVRQKVNKIIAVGTSALRDARNAQTVRDRVARVSDITIDVIDGDTEAALLHLAVGHVIDLKHQRALLIDMGGGSLELVYSNAGRIARKISLPIGTVRLLTTLGRRATRARITAAVHPFLDSARAKFPVPRPQLVVGTGGNLRAMGKLCHRLGISRAKDHFTEMQLVALIDRLFALTYRQRMTRFQLKADRADVILPAAVTVLELMRAFDAVEIRVPDVGLKNGLFWRAFRRR